MISFVQSTIMRPAAPLFQKPQRRVEEFPKVRGVIFSDVIAYPASEVSAFDCQFSRFAFILFHSIICPLASLAVGALTTEISHHAGSTDRCNVFERARYRGRECSHLVLLTRF